jgi:hypothetical protein
MKLKKLNMRGFSHDIVLVLFVVIFAIGGVGYLIASHADSCNPVSGVVSGVVSGEVSGPVTSPASGPVSGTACQSGPLTAPTNYAATNITTSSFVYSFSPSTDNSGNTITGYDTYRYVTSQGPGTATLYAHGGLHTSGSTIVGLSPNTTYSFYLQAYDNASPSNHSSPSNTITVTTLPLLTAPINLKSANTNANSTFLSWTPSTDNTTASQIAGYNLYRYVTSAGASTAVLYSKLPSTNAASIVGLSPGTTYSFYLQAFDTSSPPNVSASSSTINITTSGSGEQLSKPPARRPAQYIHVCMTGNTTYVTQGTPNCLAGGTFQFNYDPSVPGTYYNIPCQATNTSALRYAYIASGEKCPSGTTAVGGAQLASGEQLSVPPARRPAQYVHICLTGNITYITQGTPNCLAGSTFVGNYGPNVAGTVYSRACETTSGSLLRYAYISTSESCPGGTALISAIKD